MTTRYRIRWSRCGKLRYLSAHDIAAVLERSVRRSKLPLAYSQGFSPHPKISFATALPVGYGSSVELIDMTLTEEVDVDQIRTRFNASLPEDLRIEGVAVLQEGAQKLGTVAAAADYVIAHREDWLPAALDTFIRLDSYDFVRPHKGETRTDDLRAGTVSATSEGPVIRMRCQLDPRAVRPSDVITALAEIAGRPAPHVSIERTALLTRRGDTLVPIDEHGVREEVPG
jgi:radical SAM-linked protein